VVSQELLEILRCPSCVRDDRPDPGRLDRSGNWLICKDCDRKYPIRDDIPVMLIEEGDRFRDVLHQDLPEIPPPEERSPMPAVSALPGLPEERQKLLLTVVGMALGIGLIILLVMWLRREANED
jgi:uncharacterized protein